MPGVPETAGILGTAPSALSGPRGGAIDADKVAAQAAESLPGLNKRANWSQSPASMIRR